MEGFAFGYKEKGRQRVMDINTNTKKRMNKENLKNEQQKWIHKYQFCY